MHSRGRCLPLVARKLQILVERTVLATLRAKSVALPKTRSAIGDGLSRVEGAAKHNISATDCRNGSHDLVKYRSSLRRLVTAVWKSNWYWVKHQYWFVASISVEHTMMEEPHHANGKQNRGPTKCIILSHWSILCMAEWSYKIYCIVQTGNLKVFKPEKCFIVQTGFEKPWKYFKITFCSGDDKVEDTTKYFKLLSKA